MWARAGRSTRCRSGWTAGSAWAYNKALKEKNPSAYFTDFKPQEEPKALSYPKDAITVVNAREHNLKNLSLQIPRNKFTVVTGVSGSGKSTLIRLINQLETLTGGSIEVDGELIGYKHVTKNGQDMLQTLDDKEIAAQRSRLGMVFQRFNLFPHMTALENVMEAPIHVQHQSKKAARDLAVAELQRVGLGDRMDYYPSQLSGGQQQRVAIARALAMKPEIRAVTIRQSPKPTGRNTGASTPARRARMLSCESATMLKPVSKF